MKKVLLSVCIQVFSLTVLLAQSAPNFIRPAGNLGTGIPSQTDRIIVDENTTVAGTQFTVELSPVASANRYQVQWSTSSLPQTVTTANTITINSANGLTGTVTLSSVDFPPGRIFYLRARSSTNSGASYGTWSTSPLVLRVYTPPVITTPASDGTVASQTNVNIAWTTAAYYTGNYKLQYSVNDPAFGSASTTEIPVLQSSSFTLAGPLTDGSIYYIRVSPQIQNTATSPSVSFGYGDYSGTRRIAYYSGFPPTIVVPVEGTTVLSDFAVTLDGVPGAEQFEVNIATQGDFSDAQSFTSTTRSVPITISNPVPGQTYYLRARARVINTWSSYSATRTVVLYTAPSIVSINGGAVPIVNGQANEVTNPFTVNISSIVGASNYEVQYVQGDQTVAFPDPSDPTYQSFSAPSSDVQLSNLIPSATYRLRARATLDGGATWGDFGPDILITMSDALDQTYLDLTQIGGNPYQNAFDYYLPLYNVSYAESYDYQISPTNDFSTAPIINISTPYFLQNTLNLVSGGQYFVRARIRFSGLIGDWGPVYSFYNSLHPLVVYRPTGAGVSTATKLVANVVVGGSDAAIFQIYQDDGDGIFDPSADPVVNLACTFRPCPFITDPENGQPAYLGDWARNVLGFPQWTYDYVQNLIKGATYHIQVKAVRRDGSGGYLQPGYWHPSGVATFTVCTSCRQAVQWDQAFIAPSPFVDETQLNVPEEYQSVRIRVSDLTGRLVEERTFAGSTEEKVSIGKAWSKGMYIIQLYTNGTLMETIKAIKQ